MLVLIIGAGSLFKIISIVIRISLANNNNNNFSLKLVLCFGQINVEFAGTRCLDFRFQFKHTPFHIQITTNIPGHFTMFYKCNSFKRCLMFVMFHHLRDLSVVA